MHRLAPVSYTHLDVYKRQILHKQGAGLTPESQKHDNPVNRNEMHYNPKEVENGRWF